MRTRQGKAAVRLAAAAVVAALVGLAAGSASATGAVGGGQIAAGWQQGGGAPNTRSPVADAAQRGDLEAVQGLLRQGADPNAAQNDGMTGLHWAASRNDTELARALLYAGATVRAATRLGGYAPLHLASRAGHAEVAEVLLEAGADANRYTSTGATALHFAAEADATGVIEALAARGGDVNARDRFAERTPLMFAAARGANRAVEALTSAGADLSLVTRVKDYEALDQEMRAEQRRRAQIMAAAKAAEAGEEPEEPEAPGAPAREPAPAAASPPDSAASEKETPETPTPEPPIKALTSAQQIGKQGGFAALHFAAREGHRSTVALLADRGAEIDQPTAGDHSTPLLVAVVNGNYDAARDLLERGADPNLTSDDGAGPLFATLNIEWSLRTWYPQPQAFRQQETRYLELMKLLLDAGADPNQRTTTHIWYAAYNAGRMGVDFTGATPFWRAAYAVDVDAMRLLVEHGADHDIWTQRLPDRRRYRDPNFPDTQPDDAPVDPSGLAPIPVGGPAVHPLHAASGVGFGTSRVAQQHRAVPDGWLPAVRYLIEELGVDPNLRDKDGYNAIHHAAARGDNTTILYLASQGTDVHAISRRGQTTADLANSPEQRAQPLPATVALLEKLGSRNNHECRSCGGSR